MRLCSSCLYVVDASDMRAILLLHVNVTNDRSREEKTGCFGWEGGYWPHWLHVILVTRAARRFDGIGDAKSTKGCPEVVAFL